MNYLVCPRQLLRLCLLPRVFHGAPCRNLQPRRDGALFVDRDPLLLYHHRTAKYAWRRRRLVVLEFLVVRHCGRSCPCLHCGERASRFHVRKISLTALSVLIKTTRWWKRRILSSNSFVPVCLKYHGGRARILQLFHANLLHCSLMVDSQVTYGRIVLPFQAYQVPVLYLVLRSESLSSLPKRLMPSRPWTRIVNESLSGCPSYQQSQLRRRGRIRKSRSC